MLNDVRHIANHYGPHNTFVYDARRFLNYEQYVVFENEATQNILLSLLAVFIIILSLTANAKLSLLILVCIGLVDLYLLSLLTFWDVAFNSISNLNVVIAVGLAVDYSAHIGHSYLVVEAPEIHPRTGAPMTDL